MPKSHEIWPNFPHMSLALGVDRATGGTAVAMSNVKNILDYLIEV